jgi:pyruvate, water dikinase
MAPQGSLRSLADTVVFFTALPPQCTAIAGGKGASLSRVALAGLPVPPGFVVSAAAFQEFLETCGGVELIAAETKALDLDDSAAVEEASARIRGTLSTTPLPESIAGAIRSAHARLQRGGLVAVRSSAVCEDGEHASFAGQQETYLNVHGIDDVLRRVRDCWASFFSPRALFYRGKRGVLADTRMAVVVQEMVVARTSGVLFTVDPIRNRRDCMVIEAAPGLGDALVSGEITPDHYVVSRRDGTLIEAFRPDAENDPLLGAADLDRLCDLGLRLEELFESPQDIEWCIADTDLLVLQSRPITTLSPHV